MNKLHTYKKEVTRTEIFQISEAELNRERKFQKGKQDRLAGKPCAFTDGCYLDGWYNPQIELYFISKEAAQFLGGRREITFSLT